ncbi:TIR domain-containing protein [Tenacibaculum aestuarii]|uniref:TIR domain-containing protein n=1 Tax=Tenacibaculum aestuarii TaxID=362781 RepID=UPI0038930ABE
MANPRAFISFDFDHNKSYRDLFVGQIKNSKTPFEIQDWSSKTRLPQKDWEKLINQKINKCNMLIVLVGKNTHMATGVKKEILFSHNNNVPVFGVYIDGANSTTKIPSFLQRNRTISWNWDKISAAINQCMTEGKNK